MSSLLFLDVEATGVEEEDRLCQVAYHHEGRDHNEFFRPPVPIKLTAMAVHHITARMVEDKPAFAGSLAAAELARLAKSGVVLVAHNAPYDLGMLGKEGIHFEHYICTLKVIKHLDPHGKLESHQLQFLRYLYGVEISATAHDALGDITILREVFTHLHTQMRAEMASEKQFEGGVGAIDDEAVIAKMIDISRAPTLIARITFGKHRGKTVLEVAKEDRGYLEWLLEQKLAAPESEEDWIYTLTHHLNHGKKQN